MPAISIAGAPCKGRLQASFKENTIDYGRVLRAMRRTGYSGYIGVEYVWVEWEHCNECDNLSRGRSFSATFSGRRGGIDSMTTPVLLPQFELTMASATIARWLAGQGGDRVTAGQNLVEIETQKAVSEVVTPPVAAVVRRSYFADGATVPTKATLCILTTRPDEAIEAGEAASVVPPAAWGPRESGWTSGLRRGGWRGAELMGSGLLRRRSEGGAGPGSPNWVSIRGTGPAGRITPKDVLAFRQIRVCH